MAEEEIITTEPESNEPAETELTDQDTTGQDYSTYSDEELAKLLSADAGEKKEEPEARPELEKKEPDQPETPPEKKDGEPEDGSDKVTLSKEDMEKLQRQIREKEQFIQRQSNEVGQLRRQRLELAAQVEQLKSEMDTNLDKPSENMEREAQINRNYALMAELQRREVATINRHEVHRFVPDFEKRIDQVAQVLKEDGEDEGIVRAFSADPYVVPPLALIHMVRRAEMVSSLKEAREKITELESQLAEARKSPERILSKITETASRPNRNLTAAGATTRSSAPASLPVNLSSLSDAELKKLIDERLKEEAA